MSAEAEGSGSIKLGRCKACTRPLRVACPLRVLHPRHRARLSPSPAVEAPLPRAPFGNRNHGREAHGSPAETVVPNAASFANARSAPFAPLLQIWLLSTPLSSRQTRGPGQYWDPALGTARPMGSGPRAPALRRSFPLYLARPNFLWELWARARKRMKEARTPGGSSGSRTAQRPRLRILSRDQNAPPDSARLPPAPGLQGREPGVRRRLHLPRGGTALPRRVPGCERPRSEAVRALGPGRGARPPRPASGPAPGGRIRKQ